MRRTSKLAAAISLLAASLTAQTFDVAAIHPADPNARRTTFTPTPDNGLRAAGVTLRYLIRQAWGIEDFQIRNAPAWARTDRFDIEAGASGPGPLKERLQALLTDRFQLTTREETQEGPIYVLEQLPTGHKLHPPERRAGISRNRGLLSAGSASVTTLASAISALLQRPVVDRTRLPDNYAFKLQWAEEGAPGEPEDSSGPSIFTAIRQQLGLRLKPGRAPIKLISVDRVEKPSPN